MRKAALLFATLMIAGCRHPSPAVTFHTLSPLPQASAPPASALRVEVMPVQVPELLQRSQIVLLKDAGTYGLSETHRWGNPLEKDMQRVLVEDLSQRLGAAAVIAYPGGETIGAAHRISLEIQQCAGRPGDLLQFRGTWRITAIATGRMVLAGELHRDEPVAGHGIESLVEAHDRILTELGRQIAEGLRTLK
jgi:hypothetical protein